jgi:hypothetical protein
VENKPYKNNKNHHKPLILTKNLPKAKNPKKTMLLKIPRASKKIPTSKNITKHLSHKLSKTPICLSIE